MTPLTRPSRTLVAGGVVATLLAASACSGDDHKQQSSASATPTTPSSSSSSSPAAKRTPDPLFGGKFSRNAVVAVKIDDTANGRPQRNIDKADVVYIEEVEGGLTRLVGVFHSSLPTVASVRSTRAADPELVSQYGKVAFVASGGAKVPLRYLDRSYLKTTINDRGGPGFQRTGDKPAPYNLSANLAVVAKALKAPGARDVGFSWSASTSQLKGASSGTRVETRVGGTAVEFRYNRKTHRYVRYIDGQAQRTASGALVATPNVLVQFCKVVPFRADTDVNGNPNQFTNTVGSGKVVLFRDGKRVGGTWKRAKTNAGTTLLDGKGKKLVFRPGGTWVVLTKNGQQLAS
ncbi:Protein of unknown function [Jatrophihabitans endophyticus]|uniref:DUF3048 domain-containing protein n=1 Tax=Jatrophihabitans endophyticus TaxID=1206085 RepID=A0A1M5LHM3_9ACTN|nr:DUF3048 domain-containing protein [Jatrophihabitans endophyticus]SHG64632.1 Protein of unknown function [Jatrophihabitans endophyticus]